MMLKVGELAQKTGLTVRTLHHYDEIGLLAPSARSAAGYRLYTQEDVARLHAIQALRQLGMTLAGIGEVLARQDVSLAGIVARQMRAIEEEIARAQALRERLDVLAAALAAGRPPEMAEWLATLDLMATYGKYFSTDELGRLFRDWKRVQADWAPLVEAVRDAHARHVPPESAEVQCLAQRWMDLSMQTTRNDLGLALRWGDVAEREPGVPALGGIDPALIRYIGGAIGLRMAAWQRHLSREDLQRLDKSLAREWAALGKQASRLMRRKVRPDSAAAQALGADWERLIDRTTGNDPGLRARFLNAYREEPLLRVGHAIPAAVREFMDAVTKSRKTA